MDMVLIFLASGLVKKAQVHADCTTKELFEGRDLNNN